jgi:RsiW-degrading membrane proteinase PrsW (M82 family)
VRSNQPDKPRRAESTLLPAEQPRSAPAAVRILTLIAGLCIAVLGLLIGSLSILVGSLGDPLNRFAVVTAGSSIIAAGTGLGLAVAWQAWHSLQGKPSAPFRPRGGWLLVLAFLLIVATGQAILSLNLLPAAAFAPFHILAGVLPPLAILALVGRRLGGWAWGRDVILQLGSGGLLSTPLAFFLEMAALMALSIAALLGLALRPGGLALLEELAALLETGSWVNDPTQLVPAIVAPSFILLVLLVVAGIVPLVEEAVKTIGLGLMAYRRPERSQAFLWGLASGAGFALVEGLLNTSSASENWAAVILLRVGGTLLHCFTGGLMGLAWHQLISGARWRPATGLYLSSVAIHSLWNALSLGIGLLSLDGLGSARAGPGPGIAGLGTAALLGALALVALAMGIGLVGLTLWLRARNISEAPMPGTGSQRHDR